MKIVGVNPYIHVSATRAKQLKAGWRKPMPVLVRVNGQPKAKPWRINMMPSGKGWFYLYLHGDVRKASKTGVGDRVEIEVAFDETYRGGPAPMPAWFRSALAKDAQARAGWDSRTPSRQKEILRYLMHIKTPAVRTKNIARAIGVLAEAARRSGGHR
jgi:hypothetical protein